MYSVGRLYMLYVMDGHKIDQTYQIIFDEITLDDYHITFKELDSFGKMRKEFKLLYSWEMLGNFVNNKSWIIEPYYHTDCLPEGLFNA